ncbi:sphingomyelin phosphodiesterase [Leptospira weilii serovar Ranarum str. ICFT]|uniref:Sphingomyelin phosphodiesterase n=2 Tax=Leptospira weilii TaxID=28184 RepID=N1WDQ5_9LEPT|nr:sphingomyelin phosphodiesterase [Leptospira weilii serovar Ranarum str. ICFT]
MRKEIRKEPKRFKKQILLVSYCLFSFLLLRCLPDKQNYNNLLIFLIATSDNKNVNNENVDSPNSNSADSSSESTKSASASSESSSFDSARSASASSESSSFDSARSASVSLESSSFDSARSASVSLESSSFDSARPASVSLESSSFDSASPASASLESSSFGSARPASVSLESSSFDSARPAPVGGESTNVEIKILSHNVSMMSAALSGWKYWGQNDRAERIASANYIKNQDVIVFERLSDNEARKILLDEIRFEYPYQTDVIGKTKDGWDATFGIYRDSTYADGGVVIVSKWPIEERIQYIFNQPGCGQDQYYHKGFAYVRINKNGKRFHIIGTQVQTAGADCADSGKSVRANQFDDIRNFIDSKGIPKNETVLIAGNLNVIKGSSEYSDMLIRLNTNEPTYAGVPFTWNTKTNGLAAFKYRTEAPAYLDYILVSKSHAQPPVWQNLAYDPISTKTWKRSDGYTSFELSDYYPVYGFTYADSSTPTKSGHKRKYDQVSFVSTATGKRIQVDSKKSNGWLKADSATETGLTKFNLLQENNSDSNPSCMKSGHVRIEPSYYLNYFWNWWYGGGSGNYGYYPEFKNGSNNIEIINLDGRCLQDGSRIVFQDYDTSSAKYYYLTVWGSGSWNNYLFLWKRTVTSREIFYLRLNSSPERDWSGDLIYR